MSDVAGWLDESISGVLVCREAGGGGVRAKQL